MKKLSRRQVMAKRRKVTYTVVFAIVFAIIVAGNIALGNAQLRSLNSAPDMVWHNGVYMEQSAVDELIDQEVDSYLPAVDFIK